MQMWNIIISSFLCFCGKLKTTTSVETQQPPSSLLHKTREMSFGKIKLLSLEKLLFGWMAIEKRITSSKCQMYALWITKINLSKAQIHEKKCQIINGFFSKPNFVSTSQCCRGIKTGGNTKTDV